MTKVEMFDSIIAVAGLSAEQVEFLEKEKAAVIKRNSRRSDKPSKKQAENDVIKGTIVNTVADGDGMTATEVATAVGITLAKATALLTQLVKSEEVKREVEKKVARFYIA